MNSRPSGYAHLIEKYNISSIPHWHLSSVATTGTHRIQHRNGFTEAIYRPQYWPGETTGDHLEFALKYDGVNLCLLKLIFDAVPQNEIISFILAKPTGKYARRIWFFYEYITGKPLPLDDLSTGNYVHALETEKYYTIKPGVKSKRHRVVNNLLGPREFCPIIRRTEKLIRTEKIDIRKRCTDILHRYPPELLRRASSYFYSKETKSSFEIEHIKPSASRTEKFIAALQLAGRKDFFDKASLIDLQNRIVDPRFRDNDYRTNQNYIGQTLTYNNELIHYIAPRPKDITKLMNGLITAHQHIGQGLVPAVIHAAVTAFGFVFLHPFEDGNGRIHRFLIHNILATRGLVPEGMIFPVSAVILKKPKEYDASLEAFSRPLLTLVNYDLDDQGQMSVLNETAHWYQFMDMTTQVEALYDFVLATIEEELAEELSFLTCYDKVKKSIQHIIDMPDRLIDLFIQCCHQNNGKLSLRKRADLFEFLTDKETTLLEKAFKNGFQENGQ